MTGEQARVVFRLLASMSNTALKGYDVAPEDANSICDTLADEFDIELNK